VLCTRVDFAVTTFTDLTILHLTFLTSGGVFPFLVCSCLFPCVNSLCSPTYPVFYFIMRFHVVYNTGLPSAILVAREVTLATFMPVWVCLFLLSGSIVVRILPSLGKFFNTFLLCFTVVPRLQYVPVNK